MIRRYDDAIERGRTYRHRPGAYAVLWRDGRLLLTWQAEPHREYQLPGGGIEPGEQPIPALHREVAEETGWHFALERKLGSYRRFTYMPDYGFWAEKICHLYLGRPTLRLGPASEVGHEACWMTPEEALRNLANGGDRAFLRRLLTPVR
jgi:8-oxo-dGTP diphosphatase